MAHKPYDLDEWEETGADPQLDEHSPHCDCIICAMHDDEPLATAIPPVREATWRVVFADFRDYHDWIGPTRPKRGGTIKYERRKLPPTEHRDFLSRAAAYEFAELLRADYGGEIACVIIDLKKPPPSPAPVDERLPGHWPLQKLARRKAMIEIVQPNRPFVTQLVTKKGRPTVGKRATTDAEWQRRHRRLIKHEEKRDPGGTRKLDLAQATIAPV